jgi:hypothetical protein
MFCLQRYEKKVISRQKERKINQELENLRIFICSANAPNHLGTPKFLNSLILDR